MNDAIVTLEKRLDELNAQILTLNSANIIQLYEDAQKRYKGIIAEYEGKKQDVANALKILRDTFKK